MKTSSKRIGVHGAGGKMTIVREDVVVSRAPGPVGKGLSVVSVDMEAVPVASMPSDAELDLVIRDGKTNQEHCWPMGRVSEVDRADVAVTVPTTILSGKTGIFLQIVDPSSNRFLATSERIFLPADNADAAGRGDGASAESPIVARVDRNQCLPSAGILEDAGPVISFGKHGPASTAEAKLDEGVVKHAIIHCMEKFIRELLTEGAGETWQGARWDGFRKIVAVGTDHKDWDELVGECRDRSPRESAEYLVQVFLPESRLERMIEAVVANTNRAVGAFDQE